MNPVTQLLFTFLGIVVAAAGSFFAARYTSKSSVKAKEIDVKAAAYSAAQAISTEAMAWLKGQIAEMKTAHSELETKHDKLKESHELQGEELRRLRAKTEVVEGDLEIAVNWMEQFLAWEQDGSRPPRPHIPNRLRKRIKQTLLVEQRQEQLEHNREDG